MKKLTLSAFLLILIGLFVSVIAGTAKAGHETADLLNVAGDNAPQIGITEQSLIQDEETEEDETTETEGDDMSEGEGEIGDVDDADCAAGGLPDIVLHKINGPNASNTFTARHYCGMVFHSYWQELGPPVQIWKKIGPNLWKKVAP